MDTQTQQSAAYTALTLLFSGLTLFVFHVASLIFIFEGLFLYAAYLFPLVIWLLPASPLFVALFAFALMRIRAPLPLRYAGLLLLVVLYVSGILAVLFVGWVTGDHHYSNPLAFDQDRWFFDYGPYGISAGLMWVMCMLRSWRHVRLTRRSQTEIEA